MAKAGYREMATHYEEYGWGEQTVLFLHTWVGTSAYWLDTMTSMPVSGYAVAPDLWGFGQSGRPANLYSIDGYLRQMREFIQQLQLEHIAVVGHGLGAVVGLFMAVRIPQVERLMAIAMPLMGSQVDEWLKGARTPDIYTRFFRSAPGYRLARDGLAASDWMAVARTAREVGERSFRPLVQGCRVPLLLVHGVNDRVVRPPMPRWLEGLGSAGHVPMENSYHFPMVDEPQRFRRLLGEFLTGGRDMRGLATRLAKSP